MQGCLVICLLLGHDQLCKGTTAWQNVHFGLLIKSGQCVTVASTLGPPFSSVRCCCAFGHPNHVKGWCFLGCCPATAFSVAVWQNHQPAFTFIAGCLGACLAVWMWGMHGPRVAAANRARLDLQRLYDYDLRTICGLLPSTRCCWQSWVCCLCKCYGGSRLCVLGTAWLHCQ